MISVPNGACLRDRLRILFGKQPKWHNDVHHIHLYTKIWLKEHLENHGFSDVRIIGDGFLVGGLLRYKYNIVDKLLNLIEHHIPSICNILMVRGVKAQDITLHHERAKS